ncbi:hypothetical protein RCL1_007642 [Eukaryota sp. TZLM3-RCL]
MGLPLQVSCTLSGQNCTTVPLRVLRMTQLVSLDMSFNRLTQLPDSFSSSLQQLKQLNLSNNRLIHFSDIQNLSTLPLTHLNVSSNSFRPVSLRICSYKQSITLDPVLRKDLLILLFHLKPNQTTFYPGTPSPTSSPTGSTPRFSRLNCLNGLEITPLEREDAFNFFKHQISKFKQTYIRDRGSRGGGPTCGGGLTLVIPPNEEEETLEIKNEIDSAVQDCVLSSLSTSSILPLDTPPTPEGHHHGIDDEEVLDLPYEIWREFFDETTGSEPPTPSSTPQGSTGFPYMPFFSHEESTTTTTDSALKSVLLKILKEQRKNSVQILNKLTTKYEDDFEDTITRQLIMSKLTGTPTPQESSIRYNFSGSVLARRLLEDINDSECRVAKEEYKQHCERLQEEYSRSPKYKDYARPRSNVYELLMEKKAFRSYCANKRKSRGVTKSQISRKVEELKKSNITDLMSILKSHAWLEQFLASDVRSIKRGEVERNNEEEGVWVEDEFDDDGLHESIKKSRSRASKLLL